MYSEGEEMTANINYLLMASVEIAATVLMMFRYKSVAWTGDSTKTYYDIWATSFTDTNWWELANMVLDFGKLSLWGVAWIFQLLAVFGILNEINMLIWDWGIFVGVPVVISQWLGLMGGAYDAVNNRCRINTSGNECKIKEAMEIELLLTFAISAWTGATVWANHGQWHQAQQRAINGTTMEEEEEEVVAEEEVAADEAAIDGEVTAAV